MTAISDIRIPILVVRALEGLIRGKSDLSAAEGGHTEVTSCKKLHEAVSQCLVDLERVDDVTKIGSHRDVLLSLLNNFTGKEIFNFDNPLFMTVFQVINILVRSGNEGIGTRDGFIANELNSFAQSRSKEAIPLIFPSFMPDWIARNISLIESNITHKIRYARETYSAQTQFAQAVKKEAPKAA